MIAVPLGIGGVLGGGHVGVIPDELYSGNLPFGSVLERPGNSPASAGGRRRHDSGSYASCLAVFHVDPDLFSACPHIEDDRISRHGTLLSDMVELVLYTFIYYIYV